jgi:hypothetical protein
MPNDKMLNGKKCQKDKMSNGTKCQMDIMLKVKKGRMGHNVEWDKTPNGNHVESKKGQLGQNVEWYKKNVESKQSRIRRHTVKSKRVTNVKSKEIYLKCCYFLRKKILDTTMYNNVENVRKCF